MVLLLHVPIVLYAIKISRIKQESLYAITLAEPNLTIRMFTEWVKAEYSKEISTATGNRWLCELGFKRIHHQKGVYFDGHERKDVIEDREKYLNILTELDKITISKSNSNPLLFNGQKP